MGARRALSGPLAWPYAASVGCHGAGQGIDEARAKIVATRESLQAALDLQEADIPEISQAIARLGWDPEKLPLGVDA